MTVLRGLILRPSEKQEALSLAVKLGIAFSLGDSVLA